jgi:hypothetical protein
MTEVKTYRLDRDEMRKLRQAELDKLGMTWEQVLECVAWCGCCLDLPKEFEHLNEEYVEKVWKNFDWMKLDD